MKKVAIYSRKSRETDKGESINNQIQMCKNYFLNKDGDYEFEVFQDEGFSGGNTNRPQFQRMMMLAKNKKFDIIACYKIDRIARNIVDFMNTYDILEKHNVRLVSITEGFDPSTPVGMMMMTIMAGFAEMERMNIAQRIKDNMLELAKLGRWSGGTPPTGYRSVKITEGSKKRVYLEVIPEKKYIIEKIFNLASEGYTLSSISKMLNIPSKTIQNIIRNPVYCKSDERSKLYLEKFGYTVMGELNGKGYLPYNRRPRKKDGKKEYNFKDMLATVSIHEGIIDSKTWVKANLELDSRAIEARPRISQKTFLAHLVKCKCGSGMFVNAGSRPNKNGIVKYYFQCSAKKYNPGSCDAKRIEISKLESDILELLKGFAENETSFSRYLYSNTLNEYDIDKEIENIKSIIKKYNKDIESLTNKLILLNDNAAIIVADKINSISNEISKQNEILLKLETKKLNDKKNVKDARILRKGIISLLLAWDKLSMEDKQISIRQIIKKIQWLGEDNFKIYFNI